MYSAQNSGTLKEVLVHCPGDELDILDPSNLKDYLFDALIDKEEAIDEHEIFVNALEKHGVKVHLLKDLINRIQNDSGREVLENTIKKLPNMFFTRDLAVVTKDGAIISNMRYPARGVEPVIIRSILKELRISILCDIQSPGTLEGGDVLFLDENTMLIGVGDRTNDDGFEQVKRVWLKEDRKLVKVSITPARGSMHLDTVMGIFSNKCVCIHPLNIGQLTCFWLQDDDLTSINTSIQEFLAIRGIEVIEVTSAEQFNMACNVLMIAPDKKAICYQRSYKKSLQALESNGIDLETVYLPQLFIGGGGPHCMTLELLRE